MTEETPNFSKEETLKRFDDAVEKLRKIFESNLDNVDDYKDMDLISTMSRNGADYPRGARRVGTPVPFKLILKTGAASN